MVCERLLEMTVFWQLDSTQRTTLFIAALMHDVGKIKTTRVEDGVITAPHHGAVGMQMARQLLWMDGDMAGTAETQQQREAVCLLIRYHTTPVNILQRDDPALSLRRIAANGRLVPSFSIHLLCMLAEADERGRIAADTAQRLELIQLCREQAVDSGCLYGPYAFPDDCTAHAYLSGRNISPEIPLYDDTWGEVVMLCGLPGTGKDTWIRDHAPGLPVLALDEIRRAAGIKPTEEQGRVIQEAQKRAREMLAHHQSFVFNATNVTEMLRGKWTRLFEQYHARVRIVFLETSWQENVRRNAQREFAVPESVIGGLLEKLNPPQATEAQRVEWQVT